MQNIVGYVMQGFLAILWVPILGKKYGEWIFIYLGSYVGLRFLISVRLAFQIIIAAGI